MSFYDTGMKPGIAITLTLLSIATSLSQSGQGDQMLQLRTEENIVVDIKASDVVVLLTQLSAFGSATKQRSWQLKDELASIDTHADLLTFYPTIESGWPIDS